MSIVSASNHKHQPNLKQGNIMNCLLVIIAVGLLIFFCGAGSFFYMILLAESESPIKNIISLVFVIVLIVVVIIVQVRDTWALKDLLTFLGVMGLIQTVILTTIDIPYYWDDSDQWFLLIIAGFFSQGLPCAVAYGLASLIENELIKAAEGQGYKLVRIFENRIRVLKILIDELSEANKLYASSDKLVSLLSIINNGSIEDASVL